MALPLATIRITYPEKLIIQIVKSPVSQDNRRSIAFRKHDTSAGPRGLCSRGPPLLKLACVAPVALALCRVVCRALSGGRPWSMPAPNSVGTGVAQTGDLWGASLF